jgi:ribosome-associated protein
MANEYIEEEVKKIIAEYQDDYPKNIALACAWILGNFKGENLKIIALEGKSSLADYFILGSATSSTQASSMATAISKQLQNNKIKCLSHEGQKDAEWTLLDFGDVLVHIFLDTTREIFDLDTLWKDCSQLEIPTSYYHSAPVNSEDETNPEDESYY